MRHKFQIIALLMFLTLGAQAQYIIPDEVLVTCDFENTPLKAAILSLSDDSDVSIAFQDEIIPQDSLVSAAARRKPLGLVLDQILKGSGVKYKITGNQIVLIKDAYKKVKDELTISGYLKDSENGENLVWANVYTYDRTKGTTTNEYGYYSFTLPKGIQRLYYSYAGYQQKIIEFDLKEDVEYNVELDPYIMLNEVVILDSRISAVEEVPQSQDVVAIDKMHSTLPLGGEADVLRMTQFYSGVSSGSDGFGGLSVRGGSVDQNQILLDGVPIYNASHALGLFSVFNSQIIKSATLLKGSFPARYGGMLASVMDIRTREGSKKGLRGDISLGLLAMKGSLEGPIGSKSSFLVSVRRTFADLWISSISKYLNESKNKVGNSQYYFYDINAKFNLELNKNNRLYLSLYTGDDVFNNELTSFINYPVGRATDYDEVKWKWGNQLLSLRLNSRLSSKAFLNTTFYSTSYNYRSFDHDRFEEFGDTNVLENVIYSSGLYSSGIRDLGVRMDFDFIPSNKHIIRTGFNLVAHRFSPGLLIANQTSNLIPLNDTLTIDILSSNLQEDIINGLELQMFFEDAISLSSTSKLTFGLNNSIIFSSGKSYILPQPRFAFLVDGDPFVFKAGLSFVSQYMHLIANTGIGLPADIWLPSTELVKPQSGYIANASLKRSTDKGLEYGLELYFKRLSNLVRFDENGFLAIDNSATWDENIPIGKGQAYGAEFFINKSVGKYTWDMNYTISRSTRQFDALNNGDTFLYRFDRTHSFKFSMVYKLNDNTEFSTNWIYGTGNPFTAPEGVRRETDIEGKPFFLLIYPAKNNGRLPDYHRLDVGFNFYHKLKKGRQKFTIGFYNVYNRSNPYYYDIFQGDKSINEFDYRSVSILPFLPTISYNLSFF